MYVHMKMHIYHVQKIDVYDKTITSSSNATIYLHIAKI